MNEKYIPAILELTDIMQEMELVALKHGVTYYYWIVKFFDIQKQDEINKICETNGLRWDILPAPAQRTNGKPTSTGNRLLRVGEKRRKPRPPKLPYDTARAKIIIHEAKRK